MPHTWKTEKSFYKMRDTLTSENKLFTDTEFPDSSFEVNCSTWIRPSVLFDSPCFASDHAERRTFRKGSLSAPCFGVVADILLSKDLLWSHVVAQDQSFSHDYAGMFLFRFWRHGITVSVIIDDILPYDSESEVFMLTSFVDTEDLWCTLMEKAYAKFLGGYEFLTNVSIATAMSDILNCAVNLYPKTTLNVKPYKFLRNASHMKSVTLGLSCDTNTLISIPEIIPYILPSTLYILTSFSTLQVENLATELFITLRDPFGIELDVRRDKPYSNNEHTFTVNLKEFYKLFTKVYLCLPRTQGLFSHQSSLRDWNTTVVTGKWNNSRESVESQYNPPLVRIKLTKSDCRGAKKLCTLIVSLVQYYVGADKQTDATAENTKPLVEIGIKVLALTNKESQMKSLPTGALSMAQPVAKTALYLNREICVHLCLQPGEYVIVPETKLGDRYSLFRHRYSLTLYSLEPIQLINGGPQKYGLEYLCPVEFVVSAPKYIILGDSVTVSAKIAKFPPMTRHTMTILLTFNRKCDGDPLEKVIKARMEYIEVCRDLTDKKLSLRINYTDYIRFPLKAETFVVRCSVFIHELLLEVHEHCTVQTILPKIELRVERTLKPGDPLYLFTTLYNTLPVFIPAARFCIRRKSLGGVINLRGSASDVPPFSTIWMACSIKDPCCPQITTFFTSSYFHRSASVNIAITDGDAGNICPPSKDDLQLDQMPKIMTRKASHSSLVISCCHRHKQIYEIFPDINTMPTLFNKDVKEVHLSGRGEDSVDILTYCRGKRDVTPESELPPDIAIPCAMLI